MPDDVKSVVESINRSGQLHEALIGQWCAALFGPLRFPIKVEKGPATSGYSAASIRRLRFLSPPRASTGLRNCPV